MDLPPLSVGSEIFRLSRIQGNSDWLLPLAVLALLGLYFFRRYRQDAGDLKTWQSSLLLALRIAALLALFLFYLQPQWERLVGRSRVAVLIDSSASMGNRDLQSDNPQHADTPQHADRETGPTRLEGVLDWIERSELIDHLRQKHDVAVYSFNSELKQLLDLPSSGPTEQEYQNNSQKNLQNKPSVPTEDGTEDGTAEPPRLETLKAEGEATCLGDALFEVLQRERGQPLAGIILLTDGRQNAGRDTDIPLENAERLRVPIFPIGIGAIRLPLNFRLGNIDIPDRAFPDDPFLVKVPVEMNGGEHENEAAENGAVTEWKVPVELWSRPIAQEGAMENDAEHNVNGTANIGATKIDEIKIGERELLFANRHGAGNVLQAEFEIRFPEPGRHRLSARILPPPDDQISDDNRQQTDIEIVDRKDRVLLFASGPTRDYQFLCAHIHRDKSMAVDVFLPWAQPGSTQNAERMLDRFPSTRTGMAEYDIVVAFDPNWRDLSTEQIDVLEHWVARQGGGLILFAGPIHQADTVAGWVTEMGMDKIRAMYPVEFLARQSTFDHRYHGESQAWPLKFSSAGEDAEFLRPANSAVESRAFWDDFSGFYGYFAVRGVKPTATLLAASGSPETTGRIESGTLIAEQFYGAGRILYFGSGELWRLRRVDERSYEQIATRVLRHVAQGRLQRESDRASLSTDKRRYTLGSIAQLRVTANDIQLRPLTVPTLPVDIISPAGTLRTVDAKLDANVPGAYLVHLPLTEEGTWSIRLSIPESDQRIMRAVQVRMSDLERENSSRNESLLRLLAEKSGGAYYRTLTGALPFVKKAGWDGKLDSCTESQDTGTQGTELQEAMLRGATKWEQETQGPITELLKIRSQRAVVDRKAEEKSLRVLLILICSLLMLEWTLRRLLKLA